MFLFINTKLIFICIEHHEDQLPQYLDHVVYKAQHDRQLLQWLNCRPEGWSKSFIRIVYIEKREITFM